MDIAIATSAEHRDLAEDDRSLLAAFAARGLDARPVVWNDPSVSWRSARAVVIRSTWDSHLHADAFRAWAEAVDATVTLHNPARLVAWNLHKGYLRELADRGIAITPTRWSDRGDTPDLERVLRETGWPRLVVKPAISAGATGTHIVDHDNAAELQPIVDALSSEHDLMLQPYLSTFEVEGERSYVYIDGRLSHAVRRPPTLTTTRRGFEEPQAIETPDPKELAIADAVAAALPEGWLYARVDVATDDDGLTRLQEVELIEPSLFLGLAPGATERLADAVLARLER